MAVASPALWNDLLSHLRLSHPDLVRGWFADLDPGEWDHGIFRIRGRNEAQVRYLNQHCVAAFTEAVQAGTGRLVTVKFVAAEPGPEQHASDSRGLAFSPESGLPLSEGYTFDHFVTGPCNRLAHAAAVAVSEDPGQSYNPFFIHGPVGVGKTHLLQAVCHSVLASRPAASILYLSCETFINHFISAVESGALNQFRYRYRGVDGLVIDDIQFLAERERSQEEFFHTFNTLHQSRKQIILSADCSPTEIPDLEERLVSRFNSGLVALLDRPCLETRMAIVRAKARLRCVELPDDVIRYVAGRIDGNVRDLEGAIIKIDALSLTEGGRITLELARTALGGEPVRPVRLSTISEIVAGRFGVRVTDLQSRSRAKSVTHPRHVSMYLARSMTSHSLQEIGGFFGGRDHTTVLHAERVVNDLVQSDAVLSRVVDELTEEIRRAPG